ncbi:hypothetical protein [Halorussus pelagicus]|uniref:hypothetical protein n=1 Tax=Halorussus pelagicus TaxID=2505977 RepID=UPI000FFCB089|nr:hypothetical protein [Halorussus pelagicus]
MAEFTSDSERTPWRFRLLTAAALNVVWSFSAVQSSGSSYPFDLSAWGLALGVSVLVLTPVFYHALYRDAGDIRESDSRWVPDRRLWVGGGALVSAASLALFLNPLVHYVAAAYLVQRYRKFPGRDLAGDFE